MNVSTDKELKARRLTSVSLVRGLQRERTRAASYANACAFRNPSRGASKAEKERWADRWLTYHWRYVDGKAACE